MARTCEFCGKRVRFGNTVSHSKQHTRRSWLPNIQTATLNIEGKPKRVNICTRCLRSYNKVTS